MLRQDPVECLFEFICSSNNHISRIKGMVERLCQDYGTPLTQLSGKQQGVLCPSALSSPAADSTGSLLPVPGLGCPSYSWQGTA